MYETRRYKLIGLLYLAPALLFVLVFTAYPFVHMVGMSFTSWTLITPPKFIGLEQLRQGLQRRADLDVAALHARVHAADHADPDGRRLPHRAAGGGQHARSAGSPATVVFIPVVIGLGVSSLLWYWLFSPGYGFINKVAHGPRVDRAARSLSGSAPTNGCRRGRSSPR